MSSPSTPVALRPATPDDGTFHFTVYASTRADELAQWGWSEAQAGLFLKMQFDAQQRAYRQAWPRADRSVILLPGAVPAGVLTVNREPAEIRLVDIALLPAHRGTGIGTRLLRALMAEASAAHMPLRLSVAKNNPALRLYLRLGFGPTEDGDMYVALEWPRPTAA
jgi:ribosomal protein S18 acetylase RimI-like enzyme